MCGQMLQNILWLNKQEPQGDVCGCGVNTLLGFLSLSKIWYQVIKNKMVLWLQSMTGVML